MVINMKRIEAYIRPEMLDDIKDVIISMSLNGVTISEVLGCGSQKGWKEYVRGSEVDINFLPKIRIETVVMDDQVETVIDKICETAQTGDVGDGKIFVTEVLDAVRIRTKERGEAAIK
jgi:nitrogen regulatory protein P-II 1